MPSRRCYFHPRVKSPLFGLPRDAALREQWLTFIFKSIPESYNPNIALCAAHIAQDSFLNLSQYNAGFAQRLFLKDGAVPTLSGEGAVYGPQSRPSSQELPPTSSLEAAAGQPDAVAVKTSPMMRSVGTQLSVGTLRNVHVRSKVRGSIFRPSKRPRLELEEEHEEEHDATYIPESVTQESELSIDPESNYSDKKYIVFESCLRQMFESCPVCKATCDVRKRQMGTFVAFTQLCEECQYFRRWQSQPIVGSTPVGNLQLCAATYFLGGSYAKLQKIFKAMQLQTVQYGTFRRHARNFLEPTIIHKWNRDQEHLILQLQERGKLAIAGDMRGDPPGHSAKYGSYSLMDMETKSIVDLQLIQSNEVGGSYHMEKEGLKRCLDKLESCGLVVDYIVTDRHPQIQKYLRERNVTQYYDVRHFEKALSKKLHKLSQSKDCKVLKKWLKSLKNHLNWSATSSVSGPEKVAKWTSLLNHMQNIHVHDNTLFPKCEHPDRVSRDPKKWFQPGSVALHKVENFMCNKRVLKDFEKLSHHSQTSSLKAFHRLILRFAPKNVVFPFIGMLCRLYLAAMHYNENCSHPRATTTQGQATYKIGFPKSKQGKGTAKPVKTDPTYNCVDDLMSLLLRKVIVDSTPFAEELHQITVPPSVAQYTGARKKLSGYHCEETRSMAPNTGSLRNRPQLVDKVAGRSEIWHYFAYVADSQGKATNKTKPVCKKCYKTTQAKGGNTSNLAKHLADRHPDLFKEFKERQANQQMPAESAAGQRQPSLATVFEVHRKYDKDSKDAKRLNRAVVEFICLDQVPMNTVEKSGFRNLVQQLDRKYDMPGRNYLIHNEIPRLYTETRGVIQSQLVHQPFFACTTDIWTSRSVDACMAVTIHYITESWDTQSWCLGCSALYSDHTADTLHEVLEEMVSEKWGLNLSKMSAITTDSASNNKKAFENYTWIPCFGHNLHLAVGKAVGLTRVSSVLSRLRTTVSAFSRSNKLMRNLKEKQQTLNLPVQKLVHDEPTRWNSTFEMVDRFCIQQQAVCAVLAANRKRWHLMPRDSDVATLEIIRDVLGPLSSFTDALSGEKDPTLSSVLPLKWKLLSFLTLKDGESPLSCEMKEKVKTDFTARFESRPLDTVLNTATFLDPRFKDSFVGEMEEEVKALLLQKSGEALQQQPSLVRAAEQQQQEGAKKRKEDLKSLSSTIKFEKSVEAKGAEGGHSTSPGDKLARELLLYEQMIEISASEDPLTWWKNHETTMPTLAHLARRYLCIPATSCASERVFSTSDLIRSPEEHIETLVFLAKNLKMAKELSRK